MKLLVIQLSDIHIDGPKNRALIHLSHVAKAVHHLDPDIAAVVLVFSGDLAWSGLKGEYEAAWAGIKSLQNDLRSAIAGAAVHVIAVPGNHDCDFKHPMVQPRKLVLDSLGRSALTHIDEATIDICCAVQQEFFSALDPQQTDGPVHSRGRAYYEYLIPVGNDQIILRCFNTALSSTRPENAGQMVYPLSLLKERADIPPVAYAVAILHHPTTG